VFCSPTLADSYAAPRVDCNEAQPLLRKGIVMVKVTVNRRNPEGCESLCRSCACGHIITGFRASEEEVFAGLSFIEPEIHFPVRACTFYQDTH